MKGIFIALSLLSKALYLKIIAIFGNHTKKLLEQHIKLHAMSLSNKRGKKMKL